MSNVNNGPSAAVSNNMQAGLQTHISTGVTTFANLPPASRHGPEGTNYQTAWTSDQGLVYSNGTAWVGLATASNTPFSPGTSLPAGVTATDVNAAVIRALAWGMMYAGDYGVDAANSAAANTTALNAAFAAAGTAQRAIMLPYGGILYNGPLNIPTNCHVFGQSWGTSFGTQLVANGTAGIYFDGSGVTKFHGSLNNVVLDAIGAAGAYALRINSCYSIACNNVRFDDPANAFTDSACIVEASAAVSFHKPVMQFTNGQLIGIRIASGSVVLFEPDIENCARLIQWQGGRVTVLGAYTERGGTNGLDLTPTSSDPANNAFYFQGMLGTAASGLGVAVRDNSTNVNVIAQFANTLPGYQGYAYGLTGVSNINITGITDYTKFDGVAGYQSVINFPGRRLTGSKTQDWASIANGAQATTTVTVTGAAPQYHSARAVMSIALGGLVLSAQVTAADTVTVTASNNSGGAVDLGSGTLIVSCDAVLTA